MEDIPYAYTITSEFWKIVKDAILSENTLDDISKVIDENIETCDTGFKDIWKRAAKVQKLSMVNYMYATYMNSIFETYCDLKERGY